jgi:hypothetical protein
MGALMDDTLSRNRCLQSRDADDFSFLSFVMRVYDYGTRLSLQAIRVPGVLGRARLVPFPPPFSPYEMSVSLFGMDIIFRAASYWLHPYHS